MKGWLEFTYKTKKGLETRMTSDELLMEDAVLFAEDLQRTGRVKEAVFLDDRDSYWTVKEMHKYLQEVETEPHNITVYFDGNFDRDQKKAGIGLAVYYEKSGRRFRIRKNLLMDHLETNNEAEYAALYAGVEELVKLEVIHMPVRFAGDSQVVINQLSGEWPCLEEKLHRWADKIEAELKQHGVTPEFHLLDRKNNQEADQLASQALKNINISSSLELN